MFRVKTITTVQLFYILILSIGISNHVLLIPVLLQVAKRDAWVGSTAAILPLLLWSGLIYFISTRKGRLKFADWVQAQAGKAVSKMVVLLLACDILLNGIISLRDTITWTNVTYLPATPKSVVSITFMLLIFAGARLGIRAIGVTSGLLLPLVVALGYLVMGANFQYKDYTLLFPLFTQGYNPPMQAMLYTLGGISEVLYIVLLQHHLSNAIRMKGMLLLPFFLVGLTIGPLTGAIALFGPFEAADLRFPAFEQWRMVTFGNFISHLDFLSIYQWITGTFVRVSLMMFLFVDLFGVERPKAKTMFMIGVAVLILTCALLPLSDLEFIQHLSSWYFPVQLILNLSVTLLLFILALLPQRKAVQTA